MFITTQKNGHLLVDFLNPDVIRNDKFSSEEKELMMFILILKNVYPEILFLKNKIKDGNKQFHFHEKVQLFDLNDFEEMLLKTGYTIHSTFGNYDLENYHTNSERLILWAQKLIELKLITVLILSVTPV